MGEDRHLRRANLVCVCGGRCACRLGSCVDFEYRSHASIDPFLSQHTDSVSLHAVTDGEGTELRYGRCRVVHTPHYGAAESAPEPGEQAGIPRTSYIQARLVVLTFVR